jgi:VWFA-related protein
VEPYLKPHLEYPAQRLSRRRWILSAAALLPAARLLRAQENSTFSTGVKVVNVLATVRNAKGELVHELTKDDFTIEEDGHPQPITYFSRDTNLPLTLGLLVDTSASQRQVIDQEKTASKEFLRHILREDRDHAFLIHFDREIELLQDVTSSRSKLEDSLNSLDTARLRRPGDSSDPGDNSGGGGGSYPRGPGGRSGGGRSFGGTTLYDAILLASNEIMQKQTGRKALVVLTDGVDRGSKTSLTSAIESAQRADTLVYSIYFAGESPFGGSPRGGFGGGIGGVGGIGGGGMGRRGGDGRRGPASSEPRPDGKKILERISKETGGEFLEVSKKHALDEIYDKIEAELRNQYNLGFSPDPKGSSGYRPIHVTAKGKGYTVQARDGYYYSS